MSEILFISSLAGLTLLIFILSSILSGINRDQPEDTRDPSDKRYTTDNKEGYASNEKLVAAITDAIHTYRRDRQSDDRYRAKREKVTIVVLGLTAIFALAAAGAAIYSSWIFSSQLGEMHQASVDTGNLVSTARETEERQLRAYVGIAADNVTLDCRSCDYNLFGPLSVSPKFILDNSIAFDLDNGGQTPAYDVYVEDSYYPVDYESAIPSGFAYPIIRGTEHFAGVSSATQNGVGIINPHDSVLTSIPIQQTVVELVVKAKSHDITLFYYGNIHYTDVFQKHRVTPFCFEYLPDLSSDQFANCEGHNTPPRDG